MAKITIKKGKLQVPNNPTIPFIEGDGIGVDIWPAAKAVFEAAVEKAYKGKRKIDWLEVYAGQKAFDRTKEWLPQDTLTQIEKYLFAIKGPLTTPIGGGIRSLNVALRQKLDLYACVRPVRYFPGSPSPMKDPEEVDMVIFRENTEDIYAGIEYMTGTKAAKKIVKFLIDEMGAKTIRFPKSSSIGIKPVSKEGSERLIRASIKYAIDYGRKSVTLVHKGNIMKFTEGAFKKWGYDLAEKEFGKKVFTWQQWDVIVEKKGKAAANKAMAAAEKAGKIIIKDVIADNFLQQIQLRPELYDVIATLNLNGDYVSDALAAGVGGIGIAPGANINYLNGRAIFEATHGTAPKYAGLNKVNPSSVILSGVIMFDYMGWSEAARLIEKGIIGAIGAKRVTYDFAREMKGSKELGTLEFGQEIIAQFSGTAKKSKKKASSKIKAGSRKRTVAKRKTTKGKKTKSRVTLKSRGVKKPVKAKAKPKKRATTKKKAAPKKKATTARKKATPKKRATAKKKTTARKKPAKKKTTARKKPARKKTTAKRKPAKKKTTARKKPAPKRKKR